MSIFSRQRRASRGDARFFIGIALVAVSIAGVWFLVSAADDVTPVLQANRTISQGEALTAADFQVAEVGLGVLADRYIAPDELKTGQIASRTLRKGELVPISATTEASAARSTTIVVESSTPIPHDTDPGSVVELWSAPPLDDGRSYDAPRILVADAIVSDVVEAQGMLAESGTSVELVIDRADVAEVLAAVTGGSALSVVPIGSGS
ncbi:hypothetical protein SRABI76_02728 [Microbacterium oxydans]|uniref:SAF domain-containing protein n=1 Tax=Microbacterium oxydans TaxID=82380 RepID=A0A0F0L9Y0_9MICO|nr:SAF domain-containing protein [Microbacterium oxydans]KJL28371.1 hypothetical protein RS83_03442 [Microbacterium oxydans]CAH0230064.1 hypothetical protein SRABI76_02728 [Microbacterium oxydans]